MRSVGFVQFCPARHDVRANIAAIERLLHGVRVDLIVLPELANSGYLYASPADLLPYAEPRDGSGPFLSALRRMAGKTGGAIVAGFAERAPEGLYNSAAAVDASGIVQVYRKTHLFWDERDLFLPGDTGFRVFASAGIRIGMMVCFDWYFPESARTLALLGAQVIAHPSNLVLQHCQAAMVTRCLENRVFAVTANRYGAETLPILCPPAEAGRALTFTGVSQIMDARGVLLGRAPAVGECVRLAEITPALADDKHATPRNDLFGDRRPEFYRLGKRVDDGLGL